MKKLSCSFCGQNAESCGHLNGRKPLETSGNRALPWYTIQRCDWRALPIAMVTGNRSRSSFELGEGLKHDTKCTQNIRPVTCKWPAEEKRYLKSPSTQEIFVVLLQFSVEASFCTVDWYMFRVWHFKFVFTLIAESGTPKSDLKSQASKHVCEIIKTGNWKPNLIQYSSFTSQMCKPKASPAYKVKIN